MKFRKKPVAIDATNWRGSDDINETLMERERTHGDFREVSSTMVKIIDTMGICPFECSEFRVAVIMIASKLARIACGNQCEPDHWRDIAGYATLAMRAAESMSKESIDRLIAGAIASKEHG